MKFEDLKICDPSLKLITPQSWDDQIEGPSDLKDIKSSTFVFIKDRKFFKKLIEQLEHLNHLKKELHTVGVMFQEKLYHSLQNGELGKLEQLRKSFGFVATVKSVDLALSKLTKPFYDLKFGSLNEFVDGRQMGTAKIDPMADIAQNVFIGEYAVIEKDVKLLPGVVVGPYSRVGEGSVIYPNTTLYPYVTIGQNCRIHSSVVIGACGFGYNFSDGVHHKVWHLGTVHIGNHVEIGANSAVDRGTFGKTIIGDETKIDNHVQVAHNCILGRGVILCGHTAIAGSCEIGDYTVFAGHSGIGPNLKIGAGSEIAGGALVNCSWPEGSILGGHPARPLKEWMKGLAYVRKVSLGKN